MSILKRNFFILFTSLILNLIKSENYASRTVKSMRFLIDEKENFFLPEEINSDIKKKTQFNDLLESINLLKPLRIFQETSGASADDEGFKVRCFWLDSKTMRVFDLSGLKTANSKGYLLKNETSIAVKLNLCEDLIQKCKETRSQMISYDPNDEKTCTRLAGSIVYNNNTWKLLDANAPEKGLNITLNNGDDDSAGVPYKVNIIARCNENMTDGNSINWIETKVGADRNPNYIEFESKVVCPKANFYEVWKMLNDNFWIFGIILIIFGLFLNFLGSKFVNITVYIFTCLLTIIAFFILMFQFILKDGSTQTTVMVVLAISLIIGCVFGYFVVKYRDWLLAIIIGGYTGFIFGNLLYNIGLKYIKANPQVVLWLTIIVSIAICIFVSYKLIEHFIIFATALNGSYFIVRGASLFFGGFPSETVIVDLISREEFETLKTILTPTVYIYIGSWLLLVGLGMYVQCKIRSEEDKEKLQKEANYKYFSGK